MERRVRVQHVKGLEHRDCDGMSGVVETIKIDEGVITVSQK